MSFGLRDADLEYIISALSQFDEIQKAVIFGSRVKGNYKTGSDVDIAIWGKDVTFTTISRLHAILEDESPMPYLFDIVDYTHLTHEKLREHIDRVGILIFVKNH
jgi:uncharacterized protein